MSQPPSKIPDRDQILAVLDRIIDPASGRGLNAAGLVQGLVIGEGRAGFMMEVPSEDAARYGFVRCPPFADYFEDVHSVCMTLALG